MDSFVLSKVTTTSSASSNDEEKSLAASHEESSLVLVSKRDRFLSTYRRQNFAFPDSIMHYIAMNPATPKVYQSIIKSCKYFFLKNPIIVFPNGVWVDQKKLATYVGVQNKEVVDLTKLCSKFWIDRQFSVYSDAANIRNIVSTIIPMIYRFDANELFLYDQDISFDDYVFLSSSVEIVEFYNVTVKDENGDVIAMEKLVEAAAKAKTFAFSCNTTLMNITSKTAKELFENPNFSRLQVFEINHIPEIFDVDAFYEYMKKNKTTKFDLDFDATISDPYKARLNAILNEILGTETFNYKPPLFFFDGIDREKYHKLKSLYYRY